MRYLIFGIITALTIQGCSVDDCATTSCLAGYICDDGDCIINVDQEINVSFEIRKTIEDAPGLDKTQRIDINIDAVADLVDGEFEYPFGEKIELKELLSLNDGNLYGFTLKSQTPLYMNFVRFEDFLGENNVKVNFENFSKEFVFDVDIDSLEIPSINFVQNTNDVNISWAGTPNAQKVKITIVDKVTTSEVEVFTSTVLYSENNLTIENSTAGWVSPANGFVSGHPYRIKCEPFIEKSFTNNNINFQIVSKSLNDETFNW